MLLFFMLSLDIVLIVIILDSLIVVNATTGGEQPGNWAVIMWRGGELAGG